MHNSWLSTRRSPTTPPASCLFCMHREWRYESVRSLLSIDHAQRCLYRTSTGCTHIRTCTYLQLAAAAAPVDVGTWNAHAISVTQSEI